MAAKPIMRAVVVAVILALTAGMTQWVTRSEAYSPRQELFRLSDGCGRLAGDSVQPG